MKTSTEVRYVNYFCVNWIVDVHITYHFVTIDANCTQGSKCTKERVSHVIGESVFHLALTATAKNVANATLAC